MIKFVLLGKKGIIMQHINYYYFSIFIILLFLNSQSISAQCEWLYNNRDAELAIDTDEDGILNYEDSDIDGDGIDNQDDDDIDGDGTNNQNDMFPEGLQSYMIEDDGTIVLFYCDNMLDTLYAPLGYDEVVWEYSINGSICQDWDWIGDNYFLSIDSNDPCLEDLVGNRVTISFIGQTGEQTDICEFDIEFFNSPNPTINVQGFNENESITICEEDLMTNGFILTATGMGSSPDSDYVEYQWFLGGDTLVGENDITLDISNINYNVNGSNTFTLEVSNFCSYGLAVSSMDRTLTIYEGYSEACEPCQWYFPDYDANEFFFFTPNDDGVADYFPEAPNNEYNRVVLSEDMAGISQPTCEATIYRIVIYNRLGRELFTSEYDNHPWNGKLKNGKACKDGTYFYKIEYILNPHISDYDQDKTQVVTGTVYLDSGS
tara:strand:+ start:128 stop:1423 length:1296 start_codon:yes stop_codon:yes gene_type:complete